MIKTKKAIALLVAMVMMLSFTVVTHAANPEDIGLLPVRIVFEDVNATTTWQSEGSTIRIELAGNEIILHTHQPLVYINNEAMPLQDGITLWEGRAFISQRDLDAILVDAQHTNVAELDLADIAYNFMGKFAEGNVLSIFAMLSEEMQTLGLEFYAGLYQVALLQRGSFLDWSVAEYHELQDSAVFDFTVNNFIGSGVYRISVNSAGQVDGFFDLGFVLEPLPVGENAGYTSTPIVIGEGTQWALNGLLTMPNDASDENPVPAVVLVHGSGAQNMDSSVFETRVFHDIASYLSSNGIAVIRYNKRTLTHGTTLMQAYGNNFTVWEETVEDALLAAEILQNDSRISSVFVAGHSLGGMLAPRIAEDGNLDGAILLGASPRSLFAVQYDQNVQSINDMLLAELISQEDADGLLTMVSGLLEEAERLLTLPVTELQGEVIFGIPAIWQRSLYNSLPLPIISRNEIPTLILHGDRDFQVWTDADFQLFVGHTQGYDHVQTILYANLTHLFTQAQTSYNDLREYMIPSHVYQQVLRDIVDWILEVIA